MFESLVLASVLFSTGAEPVLSEERSVIAGLWSYPAKFCHEYYQFGNNGKLRTFSGEEQTYGQYALIYKQKGSLPTLLMTTQYDNNAFDCDGNQANQTKEVRAFFVCVWTARKNQGKCSGAKTAPRKAVFCS